MADRLACSACLPEGCVWHDWIPSSQPGHSLTIVAGGWGRAQRAPSRLSNKYPFAPLVPL